MRTLLLALVVVCTLCVCVHAQNKTGSGWAWYCVGRCEDVQTKTSPGVVLMGGGTDVAAAFQWMIQRSGGGNFVVIRTDGTDAYNPWIYAMGNIHSVATIIMNTTKASEDPFVVSQIENAEALWITGGDQSLYIKYWNATSVQKALISLVSKGVPIGGTSAGMAVLGQFIYTAMSGGSATSEECLKDPYNRDVSIGQYFLHIPYLTDTITDMHFYQRDRMGRSITFVARIMQDKLVSAGTNAKAICGDEQTALLLDPSTGVGVITSPVKNAHMYYLQATEAPTVCKAKTPLTFNNVSVMRAQNNDTINLGKWSCSGSGCLNYILQVKDGKVTSSNGSIY